MKRRKFLHHTASATTAMLLAKMDVFALPLSITQMKNDYKLVVLGTNWGFTGTVDAFCAKAKMEGYDGIEMWWPTTKEGQYELFAALEKHSLKVGFLVAGHENNFSEHFASFKKMIDTAVGNTNPKPLYINCHSGKDYFSYEDNKRIIDHTMELAAKTGLKICHETHRSRMMYAAPVTRNFIEKIPNLRLTLDVSHWCNVHESLLSDQQETMNLALQRVDHIHARIGHAEGPQVNDPRAPEWEQAVKAHFAWWDAIVKMKKEKGETITFLTEFGPPDYMPTEPYTRKPLADQWAINVHMMQLLRKRYG